MKMVMSSALLLPVMVFVSVVNFQITLADEKACSIKRNGTLTMFNGETAEVKLPCKYRLSDFTCGDYRVKVTPGSALDKDYSHRFSPDTVWVKVVNTKTSGYVEIRTSVRRLDKFSKVKVFNPWKVKNGSVGVVDFANYDQSKAAAVLRKDGIFSVEFSSAERSVVVTCFDEEFFSEGLPEALCGNGTTPGAMKTATMTLFQGQEDMTDDALVNYVVLNHDNVVQSPTCKDLASKFTSCKDTEQAAKECVAIFGDQAECLAGSDTSLRDYYAECLKSVCDDDTSALEPMDNYIRENCGPWLGRSCSSDADCPDGINIGCVTGKCLCTTGYSYSFGQDICVGDVPCSEEKTAYCADGTCSYADLICNTKDGGCPGNSDEMNCPIDCSGVNQFLCDNGNCISVTQVCNNADQCQDQSDEKNCDEYTCVAGRMKCTDNVTCIRESDLCDGYDDCNDESDEDPTFCEKHTCLASRWQCADNVTCIDKAYVCDDDNDCADRSDEDPDICGQVPE